MDILRERLGCDHCIFLLTGDRSENRGRIRKRMGLVVSADSVMDGYKD